MVALVLQGNQAIDQFRQVLPYFRYAFYWPVLTSE